VGHKQLEQATALSMAETYSKQNSYTYIYKWLYSEQRKLDDQDNLLQKTPMFFSSISITLCLFCDRLEIICDRLKPHRQRRQTSANQPEAFEANTNNQHTNNQQPSKIISLFT
jgi:hypothetical protein